MTEAQVRELIINVIREDLTVSLSNDGETGVVSLNVYIGNEFICESSINLCYDIEQVSRQMS